MGMLPLFLRLLGEIDIEIRYMRRHAPVVSPNTRGNRYKDIRYLRAYSYRFSEYYEGIIMRISDIRRHAPVVSPNTRGNSYEDIRYSRACPRRFSEYYGKLS